MRRYQPLLWIALLFLATRVCAARGDDLAASLEAAHARLREQIRAAMSPNSEFSTAGIDEALATFRAGGDRRAEMKALLVRGLLLLAADKAEEAAATLETHHALAVELDNAFAAFFGQLVQAHALRQGWQPELAETPLRSALAAVERIRIGDARFDLGYLKELGELFGAPPGMDAVLGANPMVAEVAGPLFAGFFEAMARDELAGLLVDLDRLDEAEQELQRAVAAAGFLAPLLDGGLQATLGLIHQRRGAFDRARESYRKALAGTNKIEFVFQGDGRLDTLVLARLTDLELLAGRPADAAAWNEKALALAREGGNPQIEIRVLRKKAKMLLWTRPMPEARAVLEEARRLSEKLDRPGTLAGVLADLGGLALVSGPAEEAVQLYGEAARLETADGNPSMAALVRLNAALAFAQADAWESAASVVGDAREVLERLPFPPAKIAAAMLQALADGHATLSAQELDELRARWSEAFQSHPEIKAFLEENREVTMGPPGDWFASAIQLSELARGGEASAIEVALPGIRENARAIGQRDLDNLLEILEVALLYRDGRREEAIARMAAALDELDAVAGENASFEMLTSYLGGTRSQLYPAMVEMLCGADRCLEALTWTERARARGLLRQLTLQRLRSPASAASSVLVESVEALRQTLAIWQSELAMAEPRRQQELQAQIREKRRELGQRLIELDIADRDYAAVVSAKPAELADIQRELEPGQTLVSYFWTPADRMRAWVVDRDRVRTVQLPLSPAFAPDLGCAFRELRHAVRGSRLLGCESSHAARTRLYDALIRPLRAQLQGATHLLIVPHRELHRLPFEALVDRERGRHLVEDFAISYLPSASVLPLLRAKESPQEGRALVLGDPFSHDPSASALPGGRAEADGIAALVGVEPRLGERATESAVRELGRVSDVIHVAGHSVSEPRMPQFSRVLLSADAGQDGNLEVHEIFRELDLSGVNLVVLSSCQSARGRMTGADDMVGLTRALLYAGSTGVISTLWDVDDAATAGLMTRFYRYLLEGRKAVDALRAAQLDALATTETADPSLWSGFVLTGDPLARWSPRAAPVP